MNERVLDPADVPVRRRPMRPGTVEVSAIDRDGISRVAFLPASDPRVARLVAAGARITRRAGAA